MTRIGEALVPARAGCGPPQGGEANQSTLSTRSRCSRLVIPSLVKTLWRWYSTGRGLMKSWAPMSAFETVTGVPGDLRLPRCELVAGFDRPLSSRLTVGQ